MVNIDNINKTNDTIKYHKFNEYSLTELNLFKNRGRCITCKYKYNDRTSFTINCYCINDYLYYTDSMKPVEMRKITNWIFTDELLLHDNNLNGQ